MAKKPPSNAQFWLRYLLLSLGVIVVGVTLIILLNREGSMNGEPAKDPAAGMSKFYADYRMSSSQPRPKDLGDFVIEVEEPEEGMDNRLSDMESLQSNIPRGWVGEYKFRDFKAGSTLRESISAHAQNEGMQVLWELDQDFIIKVQFQIEDTIVGSLHKIAGAIGANFDGDVETWFCPRQRALVITNKQSNYLLQHCEKNQRDEQPN